MDEFQLLKNEYYNLYKSLKTLSNMFIGIKIKTDNTQSENFDPKVEILPFKRKYYQHLFNEIEIWSRFSGKNQNLSSKLHIYFFFGRRR